MSGGLLRVAVIGLGDISELHLRAIAASPIAELVGVADTDAARAAQGGRELGVPGVGDPARLIAETRPDVVHLCTPHATHLPLAELALAAGCHVLTEKPSGATLAQGERLAAVAEEARARDGVKVGVCFQNRYNTTSRALREALAAGDLGRPRGALAAVRWHRDAAYYARRPWRGRWAEAGGGVLINQAIHTLDLLCWLLGAPEAATGRAGRLGLTEPVEVEDTASVWLRHRGGVQSALTATNLHPDNAPVALEVHTERGALALTGGRLIWRESGAAPKTLAGDDEAAGPRGYWGTSHAALIEDFYAHLDAPGPFWIDPAQALMSLRALRTVYADSGLIEKP